MPISQLFSSYVLLTHFQYFANCCVNAEQNKKNRYTNYYDQKDLLHQIALQKLEIEKLKIQLDKADLQVKYWQEKVENK